VADAWMPGAARLRATDGGRMNGGAPRVVWLTTQTDPRNVSARSAAAVLDQLGRPAHLVWNPISGDVVQMVPITRAARGLASGRDGRLCVEIRVIGLAAAPFTSGPARGLDAILAWLDTWSIPRIWPCGLPNSDLTPTDRRTWSRGGHFGGSQVPRSPEPGPGPINGAALTDMPPLLPQPREWTTAPPATAPEHNGDKPVARDRSPVTVGTAAESG
jgi:hypothetical protein